MGQPIVVADDSPYMLRLLKMALTEGGFEVVTAVDGDAALAQVRERQPLLVLLDGEMPKRNGYEVARAIRDDANVQPQPRIIMLTAGGQPADVERARLAGIDEFLTKPFSPRQLLARVNKIFRGSPSG